MFGKKGLVVLNTLTLAIMLFCNFGFSTGLFGGETVGDISHKYDSLFAPAGYAFTIWSVIFLLCIAFVAYQWKLLNSSDTRNYIGRTGIWFTISNVANVLWLFTWTNEMIGWSVILILLLLVSLCVLTVRLRLELDDEPVRAIFFVWWPIVFYLGWIMVATIACVAAWLVSIGWNGANVSEETWTIVMISVASLLYLLLIIKRNLREAAIVGIWAFIAIAVKQWSTHQSIAVSAIIASVVLLIASGVHGYRNRAYSINEKIKRGEWK